MAPCDLCSILSKFFSSTKRMAKLELWLGILLDLWILMQKFSRLFFLTRHFTISINQTFVSVGGCWRIQHEHRNYLINFLFPTINLSEVGFVEQSSLGPMPIGLKLSLMGFVAFRSALRSVRDALISVCDHFNICAHGS